MIRRGDLVEIYINREKDKSDQLSALPACQSVNWPVALSISFASLVDPSISLLKMWAIQSQTMASLVELKMAVDVQICSYTVEPESIEANECMVHILHSYSGKSANTINKIYSIKKLRFS